MSYIPTPKIGEGFDQESKTADLTTQELLRAILVELRILAFQQNNAFGQRVTARDVER